ncbi:MULTISPECIES: hypothetical protein [Mesoplasma]|uniref:Uncharacterized protein n=1 Tax=Mesoplasma florum TaxID=2151 RepID=A0A2R3P7N9_MESFO|nr:MULTISPECIES: hypothetical protein [Mesoplasma]AVN64502.1 hypothetical protein CG003_02405 [Mesoplasma florum]
MKVNKTIKQEPSKEEKKLNKKVIHRKNGILLNLFGSSTIIIGLIMFSLISILIFIYVRQENLITLVDNLEKDLKTNIEKLINDAIQTVKDNTNPEEIYNEIIKNLNTTNISINEQSLEPEEVIDLFNQVLPEEKFIKMINEFLDFGEIKIPENVNLDFLRDLIKKLNLDDYNQIMLIIVIAATSLTIINLLNIIFAWRLMLSKNRAIKILFIITSVLSINIFSWIGTLVYLINDRKEVF